MLLVRVLFVGTILLASYESIEGNKLEQLEFKCTRNCDSHFSGATCWKKTFDYFTNMLIQSIVKYKNAVIENKNSKFKPFSQEKLNEIFNKTWNEFKADPKNSKIIEDPNLAEFSQILEQVTKDTFYKLSTNEFQKEGLVNSCPLKCAPGYLTVWQSLFGSFIGLTLLTILFVIGAHSFARVQYAKYDKLLLKKGSTTLN